MGNDSESTVGRGPKSLLTPSLRRVLFVAAGLTAFMLADTAYLLLNRLADVAGWGFFAVGQTSLPLIYQVLVLGHTGVGLVLALILFGFAAAHLPRVWRRYRRRTVVTGLLVVVGGLALVVSGLFMVTAAASRANAWAWWVHVACALVAPGAYAVHRAVSYVRPVRARVLGFAGTFAVLVAALVAAHSMSHRGARLTAEAELARQAGLHTGPGARQRQLAEFTDADFVPAGFVPPDSPFFPSAATTTTGGYLPSRIITRDDRGDPTVLARDLEQYGFAKETLVGAETCARCHPDIVAQWSQSAHRFASFNNPFYEATINDMRDNAKEPNEWVERHIGAFPEAADRVGMVKSKWCSACHDPALMLAGKMDEPVDRTKPEAQAGLTCLACHAIDHIHNTTGNGNYNIADEQEDPYIFATADTGSAAAFLHDTAIKARPAVHKRQMLKPFFRDATFCATCHKVSLNVPVNNYRWLRGQNEFDNWHDSGVARNASRTFYLPPTKRQCQDCHMPPEAAPLGDVSARNGMVRSHRFLAVNTALPFVRGDQETIRRIESFLQDEKLRVDVFAVLPDGADEPIMAIDRSRPTLAAGQRVRVDVVVRNLGVGHTFPGGTNDSNEGWLEFTASDDAGRKFVVSGAIGPDGHLDAEAHVYKALILDRHGQPIHRRNAQDIHVMVYANVIGPGTANIAHYEFIIPPELAGHSLDLQARLLWRKFDRDYTVFAYQTNPEAFKRFDTVPDLPVTEIASDQVTLAVAGPDAAPPAPAAVEAPDSWMRFNDYGIGLLLEGDTRGAARAFARVADLQPGRIDGHLNQARAAFQDGHLDKAYEHLRACERIAPGNPHAAWVWGLVLQEDGRYAEAVLAYRRVLDEFPEDRATWRNLGRTRYLDGQYERAVEAFAEVLRIDPEDRVAHYHTMLCYQALGRTGEAAVAEAAYEIYKLDDSAQQITRAFRLDNPAANRQAQAIRVHRMGELATYADGQRLATKSSERATTP